MGKLLLVITILLMPTICRAEFPNSGILDNFNDTEASPMTGWGAIAGVGTFSSNGTTCGGSASGTNGAYYNTSYGADVEVYGTISTIPGGNDVMSVWARGQAVTSGATIDFYQVKYVNGPTAGIQIERVIDGVTDADLISQINITLSSGNKIGMFITGTGATIKLDIYVDSGSGFVFFAQALDTSANRITSGGYNGVLTSNTSARWDNFGGGTGITPGANRQVF